MFVQLNPTIARGNLKILSCDALNVISSRCARALLTKTTKNNKFKFSYNKSGTIINILIYKKKYEQQISSTMSTTISCSRRTNSLLLNNFLNFF